MYERVQTRSNTLNRFDPSLRRRGERNMQERTRRAALGGLGGIGVASAVLFGSTASAGTARAGVDPAAAAAYGVDVRRRGATGDGTTDDSAAFRSAFAKASADGGNLVIVPPGTYRIATPLSAQAPIHLEGLAGEAGSILKFDTGIANGVTIAPAAETYPGPAIEIHGL